MYVPADLLLGGDSVELECDGVCVRQWVPECVSDIGYLPAPHILPVDSVLPIHLDHRQDKQVLEHHLIPHLPALLPHNLLLLLQQPFPLGGGYVHHPSRLVPSHSETLSKRLQ